MARQVALAYFADENDADAGIAQLKFIRPWDSKITSGEATGILGLDDAGNVKLDRIGVKTSGPGAGVGACLLALAPTGTGAGLDVSDEDKALISAHLGEGKVALGVLTTDAPAIADRLQAIFNVTTSSHDVVDDDALIAAATQL